MPEFSKIHPFRYAIAIVSDSNSKTFYFHEPSRVWMVSDPITIYEDKPTDEFIASLERQPGFSEPKAIPVTVTVERYDFNRPTE